MSSVYIYRMHGFALHCVGFTLSEIICCNLFSQYQLLTSMSLCFTNLEDLGRKIVLANFNHTEGLYCVQPCVILTAGLKRNGEIWGSPLTGNQDIGAVVRLQDNFGVGREDCIRSIVAAPISSNTWDLACNIPKSEQRSNIKFQFFIAGLKR